MAITLLLLLAGDLSSTAVVAKPPAAKWAQFLDGSLTAVFQLKRGSSELCEGEDAAVEDQGMTLLYSMNCSGEIYELKVLLQQPVDPTRTTVRRVRAEAIVTLHKDDPGLWWSSLAKHPKQFKTLIQRDTTRGDIEPDEDELVDAAAKVRARRAAGGSGATQVAVDVAGSVSTPLSAKMEEEATAKAAKLEQDVQEALEDASQELQPDGKVRAPGTCRFTSQMSDLLARPVFSPPHPSQGRPRAVTASHHPGRVRLLLVLCR